MKTIAFSSGVLFLSLAIGNAQKHTLNPQPPSPPTPPPVVQTAPAVPPAPAVPSASSQVYVYEQKPLASQPYLVTPEQAQGIINRFKESYPKMGNPRVLIYVNRELIDEEAGLKLSARREDIETVRKTNDREASGSVSATVSTNGAVSKPNGTPGVEKSVESVSRATHKNTYRNHDRKQASLADKQTMRDVERLMGRPLRLAGVSLVDQSIAAQLIPGRTLDNFTVTTDGEQARKDREALSKVADVVLEVLISSRNVTATEISGERVYSVPDIQATAIRLSDSKIIGQASASDIVGHGQAAGRVARSFGVREITEATSLSLMEDMLAIQ